MKLLVIEDSERLRRSLRRGLEKVGHDVLSAGDGRDGLRRVREEAPDLVLLDLGLPSLDGLEVVRALRREGRRVPILVLSARDAVRQRIEGLRAGADDYLVKPYDFEEVCARVEALGRRGGPSRSDPSGVAGRGLEGAILDRRYRLEEEIGSGGFAVVYRAVHLELRRPVAVKVLRPSAGALSPRSARREGVSTSRVSHPHAVTVHDSGTTEDGLRYLVMELLRGETVADALRRHGRFGSGRVAEILPPVCRALNAAHRAGIVHRDVKPENVFLHRESSGRETVKVVDFGIAKQLWIDGDVTATLERTGDALVGTLPFLSPEQVRGAPVLAATDVYGLSVTAYRMLAGVLPFEPDGDVLGLLLAIGEESPTSLERLCPELDPRLSALVSQGLAKEPADRPGLPEIAAAWEERADSGPPAVAPLPGPAPTSGGRSAATRSLGSTRVVAGRSR